MKSRMNPVRCSLIALALALASPLALAGQTAEEIDAGVTATMQRFYEESPANRELVNKAAAVLVFPHVTKAGLGVAGEHGEGALLVHGKVVGHYTVNGASVGATVGMAQRSEILLFMTAEARDKFEHSQGWTIGADAGVAVSHHGAGGQYDSETLRRPIIAFVLGEHGLIGDLSLQGSKISKINV